MDLFIQQLVSGISIGAIYALLAVGYALVYSIYNFTNWAFDAFMAFGAIMAFIAIASLAMPFWLAAILAIVLTIILAVGTEKLNEFLFAFVFITSESLRTLPIGLQSMVVGDILPWGQLMAASLLTAIPVAVLYIFAQRFLVEGLTLGGVKG